jgi:50S ribosomal subunit-associated GTPase HflX
MAVPTGSAGAAIPVSALTGEGLDALLAALSDRIAQAYRIEAPVLTRARHRQALEEAAASLHRALEATLPEFTGRRPSPRLAQHRPNYRHGRCRRPARRDLPRLPHRKVTGIL